MKGPLDRTKVQLRHLPPTITQSNLVEYIDSRFSGRYHWLSFRPGKSCLKHLKYARAYIDFNKPDDVIVFAEFFNGHVFVNEKGTQFRTIVEYAPSQSVPKLWSKKDGREGTISKDPEYLEFLEFLAKPVENLPSAEIQLERKEAERTGAAKDAPLVTPLMDYVRQKRAAKGGSRWTVLNGKPARRGGGMSSRNSVSGFSKRGSEKRTSSTMYVLRDSSKIMSSKDMSTYSMVPKQEDQQLNDNSIKSATILRKEALEGENGGAGSAGIGKKKIVLLKGKEKEIPNVSGGRQQSMVSPDKASHNSAAPKHIQQRESSGRIIRSIFRSRDSRQNQSSLGLQSDLRVQSPHQEREKKPPWPPSLQLLLKDSNGASEDKFSDLHAISTEKQERPAKNKDRPDRGVWTPIRRSDVLHSIDEPLPLSASQISQVVESAEGTHVESKQDMLAGHGGEYRNLSGIRGPYRDGVRLGSAYNMKDADGSSLVEGKSLKRGGSSGYGSHEKQVWVQKSSPTK